MNTEGTMKTFMKGAVLLTLAGLIVKILSAVYRVPFQNMVGDQGFYIYQQVYPFIAVFGIWTSYGFAVAVSKMLADSKQDEHRAIIRIAFWMIASISLVIFAALFLGADLLAAWMGDTRLSALLKTGSFAVLLMAPLAVMKGHFQAGSRMQPVAYAQVIEQAIRVTVILLGTWFVVINGFSLYAAGQTAMFGAVAGELAAVGLLIYYFNKFAINQPQHVPAELWPTVKKMLAISLSVSMSSLILLIFQMADSFTVFRLLEASGIGTLQAMELKGIYDRGQPLAQFGLLVATSLALSIVPLVAQMQRKENGRSAELYAKLAYRISLLFAIAAAAGLTFVMPYVNEMLFQTREQSAALIVFSWQIVWMSLLLILTALLYGIGKVRVPALFMAGGLAIKVIGNWLLVPMYGVMGAAIAGNAGLAFIVCGLVVYFKNQWPLRFAPLRFYSWIFIASAAMGAAVLGWAVFADWSLFDALPSRLAAAATALTAVPLGAAVFLVIIAKSRIITEKQWYIMPFGRKMAKLQLAINSKRKGDRR
ncbi:putative polysaccharide biosynthesis protein [Planomicrobium okeanokoites]|uniref:Oligosaccharide flippase family protein n=1 Tax=Planomicrobium okeanokoites TaxID=244 RepID=A0ABV7KMH9_PLAOK|nr:polysaccharide biosynthesis protein [Planomicrobium okeanokoites]